LILGVANRRSIAWYIAQGCHEHGAELALTYQTERLLEKVGPLAEKVDASMLLPCDVTNDEQLDELFRRLEAEWGELDFVVLTDASGANRVYASKGVSIAEYDRRDTAVDSEGTRWQVAENSLSTDDGRTLERLPAHRAFWFGWFAAYPDTILIK